MAKDRNDIIQDISYWKMVISSVENIPLNNHYNYKNENDIDERLTDSNVENIPTNPNHNDKDENNIYKRLTEYVKDWVESIFGLYTQQDGSLANLPEDEEGPECKEWFETVGRKLTPMADDWYQVALKGGKEGKFLTLPQMNQKGMDDVSEVLQTRDDIKNAVRSTFFPAYRALRDSFSNRSWLQWIFNHRQYVAERDCLKVMTSLITSMTGYTQKELDAEYIQY